MPPKNHRTARTAQPVRRNHVASDRPPVLEPVEPRLLLSAVPLVGLTLEHPQMSFDSGGSVHYDASTDVLEANATPFLFRENAVSRPRPIFAPSSYFMAMRIDASGTLIGGVAGDDLAIRGEVDVDGDGTIDHSGLLVAGEVLGYGALDAGTTDQYEFRFAPTGGALVEAGYYDGKDIGVLANSLNSTFAGTFAESFGGTIEGRVGPTEPLPKPSIDLEKYVQVLAETGDVDLEGLTPGYWKQSHHFDDWVGYDPGDSYEDVFGVDLACDKTLLEALKTGGGGVKALLRHSTAALLNAANPNVNYAYSQPEIVARVQQAFAACDYEAAKNAFEANNELGADLSTPAPTDAPAETSDVGQDADSPTGPLAALGDTLVFTYTVTNDGETDLVDLTVIDDNGTPDDASDDFAPAAVEEDGYNVGDLDADGVLDVGETWRFEAMVDVVAEGQQVNVAVATATGVDAAGVRIAPDVTDSDPAHWLVESSNGSDPGDEGDFQGLTPGFWKQCHHLCYWTGFSPGESFEAVFDVEIGCDKTLLAALQTGGGGANALMRHATAALLNAANPNVNYAYSVEEVIAMTQGAFAAGEFDAVKSAFEAGNEAGGVDLKSGGVCQKPGRDRTGRREGSGRRGRQARRGRSHRHGRQGRRKQASGSRNGRRARARHAGRRGLASRCGDWLGRVASRLGHRLGARRGWM